jgi:hypothetical protein
MLPAALKSSWQQRADMLLLHLVPLFLLVDCINGALLQTLGSSYGLSLGYKLLLLSAMAFATMLHNMQWPLTLLLLLILMLAGPALYWPQLGLRWALADVQLAVKALSPLLAFTYLIALQQRAPVLAKQLLQRCLGVSALVLLANALLGALGLGFSAYQPLEGVAQSFLGIKGFFYSTNELSAVLLLLSAALLCLSWPRHKVAYALVSLLSLLLALSLLTKTGILGVIVLSTLVPLLMQPAAFWQRQKTLLLAITAVASLAVILLVVNAEAVLRLLGIYDKLNFVYQQRGLSGILLSSRDYYADRIWHSAAEHYADWQRWLGVGQGGIAIYLKKYFAELDWFDLFMFYGVAGASAVVITFSLFIRHSWLQRSSGTGRVLLLLNLLLLLVSSVAGHILSSGMVWLFWALCNALLLHSAQRWSEDERFA